MTTSSKNVRQWLANGLMKKIEQGQQNFMKKKFAENLIHKMHPTPEPSQSSEEGISSLVKDIQTYVKWDQY